MSDGWQRIEFGSLSGGLEGFEDAYRALTSIHQELQQKLQSTLSSWEGSAREAYQVANSRYEQARAHLEQVLQAMIGGVGAILDQSQATENWATQMWDDIPHPSI